MKQIKVLSRFRDKFNYAHTYNTGEVVEFEDARAEDIVERGLGEFVVTPAPKAPADAIPAATENGSGDTGKSEVAGKEEEKTVNSESVNEREAETETEQSEVAVEKTTKRGKKSANE